MKRMKFILGKKLGMTQVYREDGTVVPVTRIAAGPCVVTEVRKNEGTTSVQFGFGVQKVYRLNRPEQGHLKGIAHGGEGNTVRFLKEVQVQDAPELKRGDVFTVNTFEKGDRVKVTGTAKGKGFQGPVKRHGFSGGPASHGHKDNLRMPGAIGSAGPQRVLKGTRMAGHMGDNQVSVQNLEIVEIDPTNNELLIKGAVPGARNSVLLITTKEGAIKVETAQAPVAVETPAEVAAETAQPEVVEAQPVEVAEKTEEVAVAEAPAGAVAAEKVEETTQEATAEAPVESTEAKEETKDQTV